MDSIGHAMVSPIGGVFSISVSNSECMKTVEERERPEANVIHVLTNKVQKFLFAKVASYNLFSYFTLWIFDNVDLITSSLCV